MKDLIYWSLLLSAFGAAPVAVAQVTFYEGERFDGRSVAVTQQTRNLGRSGFDSGMSSAVVLDERWEVCDAPRLRGRCMVLRQGRYPSPESMGLGGNVVSARLVPANERVDPARLVPVPVAIYDARRRGNERLYRVPVTSVRAVMGEPDRRCWIEREAVAPAPRQGSNVPGAVVGALIGGILGHQVGGGSGRDIATAGGAVVGGVVGSRMGGGGAPPEQAQTRDVERCSTTPASTTPHHWEVTYNFRGEQHTIQTTVPPGPTVTVNRRGEPRS